MLGYYSTVRYHCSMSPDLTASAPLAERMRPRTLAEYVGQTHLLGVGKVLRTLIEKRDIPSMIFWGPAGTGKTTLAHLIARQIDAIFIAASAVTIGTKEVKEYIGAARDRKAQFGQQTILFLDEIHRFNKAQQDALLPAVENGVLTLIGATTENPSFEVNAALLSRTRVFVLEPLSEEDLATIVRRAMKDRERGLGALKLPFTAAGIAAVVRLANGDARNALNILAVVAKTHTKRGVKIGPQQVFAAAQRTPALYDRAGEQHYNIISALHKSVRDSDPDGALYWLARMLNAGEDPLYVARRIVRMASEDIGMADPHALLVAIAAKETVDFVGMPEADLALAQAVVHLAMAPKSNALYTGFGRAKHDANETGAEPVPLHLRNSPTSLMKELGYGKEYKYAHDFADALVDQEHLPEKLHGKRYYEPTDRGLERQIQERLKQIRGYGKKRKSEK